MDATQRQAIEQEISNWLTTASDAAATFAGTVPEVAIFAMIGKAVAKFEPTLVEDVAALFDKTQRGDPTDAEEKALADKIQALLEPEKL